MARGTRHQLLIECGYEGHRFHGVARQPNVPTVSDALVARIESASGCTPKAMVFAARTDTGVWAEHNVITCWLRDLQQDPITVLERLVEPRDDGLHHVQPQWTSKHAYARALARGKHYHYAIAPGTANAVQPRRAWAMPELLDIDAMQRAAALLVGTHDFSAFRSRCRAANPIKHLHRLSVQALTENEMVRVEVDVEGDGFLRRMVRIIVGTLVEVGQHQRSWDLRPVLASGNRQRAGHTAPAHGLTLMRVHWENSFKLSAVAAPPPSLDKADNAHSNA